MFQPFLLWHAKNNSKSRTSVSSPFTTSTSKPISHCQKLRLMTPIVKIKTETTPFWIRPNPYHNDSFRTVFSYPLLIIFDENSLVSSVPHSFLCVQQLHDNGHSCRHPTRARCIVAESSVYQTQVYNLLDQSSDKEMICRYF